MGFRQLFPITEIAVIHLTQIGGAGVFIYRVVSGNTEVLVNTAAVTTLVVVCIGDINPIAELQIDVGIVGAVICVEE
ncbi:hypothetical protein LP7551_04936 [Roseibium album]|nr:hypothetical protein LP7551_04936 [Roseibium album]